MLSYGSQEWLEDEALQAGGPKRFPCPKCKALPRQGCVGPGRRTVLTHKERDAVWRDYCYRAPYVLAWLQDMAVPWFEVAIKDYLLSGKRPKRRRTDIQIAERRLDDALRLLRFPQPPPQRTRPEDAGVHEGGLEAVPVGGAAVVPPAAGSSAEDEDGRELAVRQKIHGHPSSSAWEGSIGQGGR